MHKLKFITVGLAAAMAFITTTGQAEDQVPCQPGYVHCAFVKGNADSTTGKFVKVSVLNTKEVIVLCMGRAGAISIRPETIEKLQLQPGMATITFSQCEDQNCAKSMVISVDSFNLAKNDKGEYIANPSTHSFDLTDTYGTACQTGPAAGAPTTPPPAGQ